MLSQVNTKTDGLELLNKKMIITTRTKDIPIPPKVISAVYRGYGNRYSCRRCGCAITEPWVNYCQNCGQAIMPASTCGVMGWNKADADQKYHEIVEQMKEDKHEG